MKRRSSVLGLYTIGIAALFLLGFLLLVVFGGQVYQEAVTGQDGNNQTRALRSYLVTCTRTATTEDVSVKDGSEGQVLTIRDDGTDYGLQIFLHEGQLMELYGNVEAGPVPEAATVIADTKVFEVEQLEDDCYAVTTDAGRTLLHVGSIGETAGAAGSGDAGENGAAGAAGETSTAGAAGETQNTGDAGAGTTGNDAAGNEAGGADAAGDLEVIDDGGAAAGGGDAR